MKATLTIGLHCPDAVQWLAYQAITSDDVGTYMDAHHRAARLFDDVEYCEFLTQVRRMMRDNDVPRKQPNH